jgi:hypothetical protein
MTHLFGHSVSRVEHPGAFFPEALDQRANGKLEKTTNRRAREEKEGYSAGGQHG